MFYVEENELNVRTHTERRDTTIEFVSLFLWARPDSKPSALHSRPTQRAMPGDATLVSTRSKLVLKRAI